MILILFSIANCSNHQIKINPVFSYGLLSEDTLKYKIIEPNKFKLLKHDSIQLDKVGMIHEFRNLVDADLKINYVQYIGYQLGSPDKLRDKIELLGREFMLDSFFYGESYSDTSEPRKSALNAVYKFTFSERNYLCFYIQDITNPNAMLNTEILLFDITQVNQLRLILHETQASENLKCFGDFNKNNKLDFAYWSFGNDFRDTLEVFELDENKNLFFKDHQHFIVIKDSLNNYYWDIHHYQWYGSEMKNLNQ